MPAAHRCQHARSPTRSASSFIEFGGWFGILNCERDGAQAFFSNQGGLNILPAALGGGSNGVIHGDLGFGIQSGRPVTELIAERIPATLILAGTALVLWISIAILLGVYAAVQRYSLFDQAVTFFSYVFYSLPTFWLGLNLIFIFAVALHWFPSGGIITTRNWPPFGTPQYWAAFGTAPGQAIARHRLASGPAGPHPRRGEHRRRQPVRPRVDARVAQPGLRPDGQGQGPEVPRVVIGKHAFRNAMLPVVTNVALEIPFLFTGAIVTETIFSLAGDGPPVHHRRSTGATTSCSWACCS